MHSRPREDREIEAVVFEEAQAVFQILLDHVHAFLRAREHAGIVDFDAVAVHIEFFAEQRQERPIAATQIEDGRAWFHPARDRAEIGAHREVIECVLVHAPTSAAMRS
jgi:hypothetical protein